MWVTDNSFTWVRDGTQWWSVPCIPHCEFVQRQHIKIYKIFKCVKTKPAVQVQTVCSSSLYSAYLYFNVFFLPARAKLMVNQPYYAFFGPLHVNQYSSSLFRKWLTTLSLESIILMNDYDGVCPAVKWPHCDSHPCRYDPLVWNRVALTTEQLTGFIIFLKHVFDNFWVASHHT